MQIVLLKPEDLPHFQGLYCDGAFECSEDELLLGAVEDEGQPPLGVGLMAVRAGGDTLLVDWLFVAPDYRRRGVATALLDRLCDAARQDPEADTVAAFSAEDDEVLNFLDHYGFAVLLQENRSCYRTTLEHLRQLPLAELPPQRFMPLGEVPDFMLRALNVQLTQGAVRNCGVDLPIRPEDYAPQSAVTCLDGRITSLVLLEQRGGVLNIAWAFSKHPHHRDFAGLLSTLGRHLQAEFPPDTPLTVTTLGPAADRLVQKLLPDAQWEPTYAAILTWEEDT